MGQGVRGSGLWSHHHRHTPNLVPWVKAMETPTSKNKSYFTCALGNKVYDEGLKIYEGFSDIGAPLTLPATAAKVGKTLLSVREMTGASNIVAFGMDEDHAIVNLKTGSVLSKGGKNIIVNKLSGSKTEIEDDGKEYLMNIWLKKPRGNLNSVQYNNVGHGIWRRAVPTPTHNKFRHLESDETTSTF